MAFRKRLAAAVVLTATAILGGGAASADAPKDWPQFHGPARDNISKETGLLKEWPKDGPPLAWKITGIGDGHASVAIANGKIFTAGEEGGQVMAFALNEADGKQLWKSKVGGLGSNNDSQGGKGSRGTPTVDGDMVYVLGPAGDLVALAAADGHEAWHVNFKSDLGGEVPIWGFSESVLIDGDHVVCIPGGKGGAVTALDKKTGKVVWRSKDFTDPAHYTSLATAEIGGVRQAVVFTEHNVAGIDLKDGTRLWQAPFPGSTAICTSPVVKDNYVYVTADYGVGCMLLKINYEAGKFTPEKVYANKAMANHHGGVVLLDGNVYGYSGNQGWVCQDFMTGKSKWKDKEGIKKGTISYADGRFYLRQEGGKGTIGLIEASPDGYKEVGRFEPPNLSKKPYWPHLVIANGKLYVRDMDTLLCYDVKAK